ncbi:cytochrome P450 [Armillaria novae-zelandiae]|uniref:Cytochrome P450 n=1 Tax=Armillaria novae-zelandiae TaxID=153914 RepID=A0AA39P4U7_9AGAR|nr:cytochrome P450 [Armillaria novae-zelandiae]
MSFKLTLSVLGPAAVGLAVALFVVSRTIYRRRFIIPNLPPGPRGLPIIGNVFDMPSSKQWLTYAEWGRQYGDICSITLLGQPLVIINSSRVMEDLDRRGTIYSDRPKLEMGGELVGYSKTVVLMPYGAALRNYRKHVARLVGSTNAVGKYFEVEEEETRKFLRRLSTSPSDLRAQLRKLSGSLIMKMIYGIEILENNDPFVTLIENANDNFNIASTPGNFLVDVFPALRFLPEWLPGGGFKTLAREWAKAFDDMVDVPYNFAWQQILTGTAPRSFVSVALENEEKITPEYIYEIKHTAGSLYGAGADTTVSAQHGFFLAMILHPEVQKCAQAEIDTVLGTDRLPGYADREQLPYVNAVVTESLRWHNVAPLGVPHRATEDGLVDGYLVPKGAIIVANLWNMLHDPEVYPDPFTFDPSRYIGKETQKDPRQAAFGFGRRVCPGMHLADASLYICIVMSLALFDITCMVEDGVPLVPVHENTSGTISHPKEYKYSLKPRSAKALSLISGCYAA